MDSHHKRPVMLTSSSTGAVLTTELATFLHSCGHQSFRFRILRADTSFKITTHTAWNITEFRVLICVVSLSVTATPWRQPLQWRYIFWYMRGRYKLRDGPPAHLTNVYSRVIQPQWEAIAFLNCECSYHPKPDRNKSCTCHDSTTPISCVKYVTIGEAGLD